MEIQIALTERKARTLLDSLYLIIAQLDKLYEANKMPRTKQSSDLLQEIFSELKDSLFAYAPNDFTIQLTETKARALMDNLLPYIKELDKHYEDKGSQRSKQSADDLNVIFEDLRWSVHS